MTHAGGHRPSTTPPGRIPARRRNATHLTERLSCLGGVNPPFIADDAVHSYYKYICRLRPETGIDIARFVAAVAAEGLPISRRYPTPLPQQPVFRDLPRQPCPIAERLSGELFTLLVHPTATTADMDDYVRVIRKILSGMS
jgi:dTDP-4-amino-4,6-dideoxygalactose transaminase